MIPHIKPTAAPFPESVNSQFNHWVCHYAIINKDSVHARFPSEEDSLIKHVKITSNKARLTTVDEVETLSLKHYLLRSEFFNQVTFTTVNSGPPYSSGAHITTLIIQYTLNEAHTGVEPIIATYHPSNSPNTTLAKNATMLYNLSRHQLRI